MARGTGTAGLNASEELWSAINRSSSFGRVILQFHVGSIAHVIGTVGRVVFDLATLLVLMVKSRRALAAENLF